MLNAYKNEKAAGKIYNLGSDNVPTQLDQADALARSIMKNCAIKKISIFKAKILSKLLRPFRTNYLTKEHVFYLFFDMILDTLSAREELGWRPQYTNMDILEKTIKWYAEKKLNI
jgi:nucleoside-diphosphate-sugar epimerase